jgi:hypothetical protein
MKIDPFLWAPPLEDVKLASRCATVYFRRLHFGRRRHRASPACTCRLANANRWCRGNHACTYCAWHQFLHCRRVVVVPVGQGRNAGWRSAFVLAGTPSTAAIAIARAALPRADPGFRKEAQPLLDFRPILAKQVCMVDFAGFCCVRTRQHLRAPELPSYRRPAGARRRGGGHYQGGKIVPKPSSRRAPP